MNTAQLVRARRMFNSHWVTPAVKRANQRAWVRSVRQLGDKWLLAQPVTKEKQ